MAGPQPPASLAVSALVRQVQQAGGFATVLHKGSRFGSALLLVVRRAGGPVALERIPDASGDATWRPAARGEPDVAAFLGRQQRFDPDLWVLELDVADPARFVPGMAAML